jgi:dGTPase
MREYGGFEHNRQSLRVVELLENAYPNFPGLNLTFEVREGLQKHQVVACSDDEREKFVCPSLEAQIANLADEITYYSHDLDDAVDFQILDSGQLEENIVWKRSHDAVTRRYPELRAPDLHQLIIREIIDAGADDRNERAIDRGIRRKNRDDARVSRPLVRYSEDLLEANGACGGFFTRMSIIIRG